MVYLPHWPIPSTLGNKQIDYETVFERMQEVLSKLDNPHLKLPPVIHVAGTNGKGSTTSIIAKIFSQAGYKTHIYTSPHLHNCNERIVLNSQIIDDNFLYEIMEEVRIAGIDKSLTFMEGFTIGAFLAFSKIPADILIMECGMGGRIDATNIVENKIATVITPISLDHEEYLGDNIKKIALEKIMILRKNVPLIISDQESDALEVIKIIANDQNLPVWYFNENFALIKDPNLKLHEYYFEDQKKISFLNQSLIGDHQLINIATAITTCLVVSKFYQNDFKIDDQSIITAIKQVKWPSRLEKINSSLNNIFISKHTELWIDGAHNEGGARVVANWIEQQNNDKINYVICGFSRGKCKKKFLEKFKNIAKIIAVRVNGEPYPESPNVICKIGKQIDPDIIGFDNLIECLRFISDQVKSKSARIVICGSLHLARDVKISQDNFI